MPAYAVKAIEDNRFGGYTAVWGDVNHLDLQGDYFTKDTDFAFEAFSHRPLIHHHGQTATLDRTIIGTIDTWKKDDTGLWCEGTFKKLSDDIDLFDEEERKLREEYIQVIKEKIEKGELNFSSGALGHLVKRADDGWLKQWFWAESSTTGSPAEPRRTEVSLLKSIKGMDINLGEDESHQTTPVDSKQEALQPVTDAPPPEAIGDVTDITDENNPSHDEGETDMTPEEFLAMFGEFAPEMQAELMEALREMVTAEMPEKADGDDVEEEEEDKTEEQIEEKLQELAKSKTFMKSVFDMVDERTNVRASAKDMIAGFKAAKPPAGSGGKGVGMKSSSQRIRGMKSRYERMGWEADDYAFLISAMEVINKHWRPSPEFLREATSKMMENSENLELSAKAFGQVQRVNSAAKANEVENTQLAGGGLEWVAEGWANNIIQKARVDNVVLPLLTAIEMPTNPYNAPIEGADPTVYAVPETTNQSQLTFTSANAATMSQVGTGKIILTAGQLAVWVSFSEIEEEDALVPVLNQKRNQAQRSVADAMDAVVLSADPAATGNINWNGGTLGTTDKFRYGGGTGLAYTPLVLNTGNLVPMGGAPTWKQLRDMARYLKAAYSIKFSEQAYIVDIQTWHALSLMDDVITVDKYGKDATVLKGELGRIGTVPIFASEQFLIASADGTVSNNSANNTKGRALLIHRPTQYIGYRRRPKVDVLPNPFFGATQIRVSVRIATQRFDNDGVVMMHNIEV
jgi:hypothetical protein